MERSERIEIGRRLRDKGMDDADIADVLNISRELVGQDLGRRKDDPAVASRNTRVEQIVKEFIPKGHTYAELRRRYEVSVWTMRTTLERLGLNYNDYAEARFKRRKEQIKKRLHAFLATKRPFTVTEIARFNQTLLHQLYSVMSLEDWKKEMGVTNEKQTITAKRGAAKRPR